MAKELTERENLKVWENEDDAAAAQAASEADDAVGGMFRSQ